MGNVNQNITTLNTTVSNKINKITKGVGSDGFTVTFTWSRITSGSRVGGIIIVTGQGHAPILVGIMMKHDGTGFSTNNAVTLNNYKITSKHPSSGWAPHTLIYDGSYVIIT